MDRLFSFAEAIINSAQSNLNGGFIAFFLNHFVDIPSPSNTDVPSSNQTHISASQSSQNVSVLTHFGKTIEHGGYAVGVAIGVIWAVLILVAIAYKCYCLRRKSNSYAYTSGSSMSRTQIAHVSLICVLLVCVTVAAVLGIVTSTKLHSNLSTKPYYNASIGLLSPNEFKVTIADSKHVFPSVVFAVSNVHAYINEFLPRTRAATESAVEELIIATEKMQNDTMKQFNDILFDKMYVTETFALGEQLGSHIIMLMNIMGKLNSLVIKFDIAKLQLGEHVERWSDSVKETRPLINNSTSQVNCPHECEESSQLLRSLTTQKESINFKFVVAFNFLTINKTPESVRAELNRGRKKSDDQMIETQKRMKKELDIPGSIRKLIDDQWTAMEPMLKDKAKMMNAVARQMAEEAQPLAKKASTVLFSLSLIFWIILFIQVAWFSWLTCPQFKSRYKPRNKSSIVCLLVLLMTLLLSTTLFLVAGYASTEVCRYLKPDKSNVTIVTNSTSLTGTSNGTYVIQNKLALDIEIDAFLQRMWPNIVSQVEKMQLEQNITEKLTLPFIKSPIHALAEACRDDIGILEAFDAVRDYDMSTMNKPEFSDRFIRIGRTIMTDSLRAINVTEMFPPEAEKQIATADQLDNFLIDFISAKHSLPREFLLIRQEKPNSSEFVTKPISMANVSYTWQTFRTSYLEPRLPVDKLQAMDRYFRDVISKQKLMAGIVDDMANELDILAEVKGIAPVVRALNGNMTALKTLMDDKTKLIAIAEELFEKEISAKTPENAARLMAVFGPKIMSQVGQCRRLYDAYTSVTHSVCAGLVSPANGIWLCSGFAFLCSCMALGFIVTLLSDVRSRSVTVKPDKLTASTNGASSSTGNNIAGLSSTPNKCRA